MSSAPNHIVRFSSGGAPAQNSDSERMANDQLLPTAEKASEMLGECNDGTISTAKDGWIVNFDIDEFDNLKDESPAHVSTSISDEKLASEPLIDDPTTDSSADLVDLFYQKPVGLESGKKKLTSSIPSIPLKVEKAKKLTIDPGSKAPSSTASDECLLPKEVAELMHDWLDSHAGQYSEFSKTEFNLALDFLKHFKDCLPCSKCGSAHAFTFNGTSTMQFKAAKSSNSTCSMSAINLIHLLPGDLLKLLVDAVKYCYPTHHTRNFLLWACNGKDQLPSTQLMYKAACIPAPGSKEITSTAGVLAKAATTLPYTALTKLVGQGVAKMDVDDKDSGDDLGMDVLPLEDGKSINLPNAAPLLDTPKLPEYSEEFNTILALSDELHILRTENKKLREELAAAIAREKEVQALLVNTKQENELLKAKLPASSPPNKPSYAAAAETIIAIPVGAAKKVKHSPSTSQTNTHVDPRSLPENRPKFEERYKDIVVDDDAFFTMRQPPTRPATSEPRLYLFKGFQRMPHSYYRKKFYELGIQAHLIRDISFLESGLMMILTYENLIAEIAEKLVNFGAGKIQFLPNADPTDPSIYSSELTTVSKACLTRMFFDNVAHIHAHLKNQLETKPVLYKTVNYLKNVLDTKNVAFKATPPKPKVFLMNRFFALEELEALENTDSDATMNSSQ